MNPVFNAPNGDGDYKNAAGRYDYSALFSKALMPPAAGSGQSGIADLTTFTNFATELTARAVLRTLGNAPPAPPPILEKDSMLGGVTKLNGPQGAFAYQPVGDQSDKFDLAVQTPPAVSSPDYAVELIELYWASLLRDVPFTQYGASPVAAMAVAELSEHAIAPHYYGPKSGGVVTTDLLFRGGGSPFGYPAGTYFADERYGPYISQLCVTPTTLGAQMIDQKVQTYAPGQDFMTGLEEWRMVQSGLPAPRHVNPDPMPRFMHNGRALAAYTHQDELYQAYLIAYLVLKSWQVPPNPGIPYGGYRNQQPFGTFGGPDIVGTLGAVAKAAINAVWWYKWRIHLRHRPEVGGGFVHLNKTGMLPLPAAALVLDNLILNSDAVAASAERFSRPGATGAAGSYLLSQAFPEGSPPHPAYPTGHGTVAGACITVLKFFFDCNLKVASLTQPVVPSDDGLMLLPYNGKDAGDMTVNGELEKLAHNISFGHGIHAGIHWRSDTDASLLLGEAVAISFLKAQSKFYEERFAGITITKMDGTMVTPFANP